MHLGFCLFILLGSVKQSFSKKGQKIGMQQYFWISVTNFEENSLLLLVLFMDLFPKKTGRDALVDFFC